MSLLPSFCLLILGASAQDEDWQRQEPEFRRLAEALAAGPNPFLGRGQRPRLEAALAGGEVRGARRRGLQTQLAKTLLKAGDIDRAIELMEEVLRGGEQRATPAEVEGQLSLMALAYLRKAETENCVRRNNEDSCIFPLAGGAVHVDREPAEQARAAFERLLELQPDDLASRWLLNIVAMALGTYPEGVAEDLLIPPSAFESEADIGRFRNIAGEIGVDTFNLCGGVIADDFDVDGLIDILTSTYDPAGPLAFYRNAGDGSFEDRSRASHAADQLGGLNLIGGDYDNDGDVDAFVLRGAWLYDAGRIRNSLLRNDDAVFTDVTRAAGVAEPAFPTQAATFADLDGDGFLDLYVGNESRVQVQEQADFPSQLFHNRGDGTFVDVAAQAGAENDGYCKGLTAGDYDNDGDLDLYLSNVGPNRLYRNAGDGTFVDVAGKLGVTEPVGRSFACWFFDMDNDGWLDLFVAAYEASLADLAAEALGMPTTATLPRLYRNEEGSFTDIAAAAGLGGVSLPMGANFGDLDHDGLLDIYLTTGEPQLQSLMPNQMFRNTNGKRFADVTTSGGLGHVQKGHGVAFADFDHDGDQDIYHQLGGFFPVDRFHNALFENPGHGNHWLYLKLVGTKTNRSGVGARIRVVVETPAGERELYRAVGSVSSFGGSPSRQEIGLGAATAITRLEITWPTSGTVQTLEDVPLDVMLRVTEGEDEYERVELSSFSFSD